jgi:hypothetical protein
VQTSANPWLAWLLYYSLSLWYALAAAIAAIRLHNLSGKRASAAIMLALVLLLAPALLFRSGSWLWTPLPEAETDTEPGPDLFAAIREDVYYGQPKLLAQALDALQPERPGEVDLYFVAFAGWASQDVFMKEANSVTELFDERFGTKARSLRLINNAATVAEVPIASRTALEQSLHRMAALMNKDEDILFLFMTSHGSQAHKLSLDFGVMRFNDIDPQVLRKLLDDSGIRHLVVSACYSGGFVDALKDDNTLVITAAAADRNSFGCSNENDYTYFGKAYFDEALRKTWSFVEAFENAKPIIAAREKREDYTPSDPQIALGKDIVPVLEAFARERGKAASAATTK